MLNLFFFNFKIIFIYKAFNIKILFLKYRELKTLFQFLSDVRERRYCNKAYMCRDIINFIRLGRKKQFKSIYPFQ